MADDHAGGKAPQAPLPDLEAMSRNMARLVEETGRVTAAYLKPIEESGTVPQPAPGMGEMMKTLLQVSERWMTDPAKAMEAQGKLGASVLEVWANTVRRMSGDEVEPTVKPEPKDARFADPEWSANPYFDFIKQAYLATSHWAEAMVEEADSLDEDTRQRARFYVKQLSSALSPTNFLATNPELIRETLSENGANLVRGMRMLAEDIETGRGEVKVRQSDPSRFEVGVNLATTLGKVIFRNDLLELIQYSPTTETVLKRPLLIVPPWINKFYILDLNPEKSFIRWAVSQGLTVFCISWVNPDERHAQKGFEHYMREGIMAALEAIEAAIGERQVTAIGYCVGGTMLSVTLGYMAATGDDRISSATLLTTQVDFTHAGDLKVFACENQIGAMEEGMKRVGYLEGTRMATAFNMLRPNDLIWPYVVNVYLKGQKPLPFDLLYWNSDSTRMPAANHSFYLRNCYLENRLSKGEVEIAGQPIDLGRVRIPIFNLATVEDHIAPARSVFVGSRCFGGPVDFVLAGSGHIAGVVNPPSKAKYGYWTGGPSEGELEEWRAKAQAHPGSWWPHWLAWIEAQAPERVPARDPEKGNLPPLCDAPGTYVRVRA